MSTATAAMRAKTLASPVVVCAPVRRIVTFHSGSLRELLFTLPALKTLRESFEGAQLCTVVREGLAPLLRDCSVLDEVFVRPEGGLSSQATLMARLHAHKFDLAIAFSSSSKSTLLAWSSGAPVRIGFDGAKMEALLTHRLERESAAPPTIEAFLDLTRLAGCSPRCYDYSQILQPGPQAERDAAAVLAENSIDQPFLVISPQPEWKVSREEAAEALVQWVEITSALAPRRPLVLVGARANRPLLQSGSAQVVDVGGKLPPSKLAALCARADLFIGYSGGASHLAAAMDTPVVALRRENEPREIHEPRGVPHRVLDIGTSPNKIVQAAHELIGL